MEGEPVPLGRALRGFRERAGLSREELAERSGLSAKGIAALERGDRTRPYPHTVRALAAALQLSPAEQEELTSAVLPRSPARPTSPVPVPLSRLLGRDRELEALVELLLPGAARLATVVGPGGVGKTRLAVAAGGQVAPLYPEGATVVWMAALADAAGVVPQIAAALGLHDTAGRPLREVLHGYLRERSVLLILDNFEHVLAGAGEVAGLLEAAPRVTVLVTSRAPLHVRGEHVLPVGPLPLPVAIQLFEERASQGAVYADGAAPDAASVAEICRRVDCLPLAVELAAARARVLGPTALVKRLDTALTLLTDGARDGPARHQTLRRTIAWSYDLLPAEERSVFRGLAAFSGGWTLEAAAAVAGVGLQGALEAHSALLDASLITRASTGDEPRFDMLQTIQAFAAEELELAGEAPPTRERHTRYFRDLVLARDRSQHGDPWSAWMDQVTEDLANVQALLRRVLDSGHIHDLALMAISLWPYWQIRGRLREGQAWVEEALAHPAAQDAGDRARLHFVAGALLYAQGAYADAAARYEQGARLARAAGDPQTLLWILILKTHTDAAGAIEVAAPGFDEALALSRRLHEPLAEATLRMGLGLRALATGRLTEADRQLAECEVRTAELGADWTRALALVAHGMVAIGLGDSLRAELLLRQALPIFRRLQDVWSTMYVLTTLADAAALHLDGHRAARLFGAADALAERCGATFLPYLPDLHRRCREQAGAQVGPDEFERLRQESRAAPLDDMVELALGTG